MFWRDLSFIEYIILTNLKTNNVWFKVEDLLLYAGPPVPPGEMGRVCGSVQLGVRLQQVLGQHVVGQQPELKSIISTRLNIHIKLQNFNLYFINTSLIVSQSGSNIVKNAVCKSILIAFFKSLQFWHVYNIYVREPANYLQSCIVDPGSVLR